jgi:hypothetical protein
MTHGKLARAALLGVTLLLARNAAGSEQDTPKQDKKQSASETSSPSPAASKGDPDAKSAAALLESAYDGKRAPEAARMLIAILRGSQMGPGDGWFGPAQTRYTWKWLASRHGVDPNQGRIARDRFCGQAVWFARLDRNRDGAITSDDLDWSDSNSYVQMSNVVNRLFRKLNAEGHGHLTKEELLQFFEKAADGKDYLSADDFRGALLAGWSAGSRPSDMPSRATLIRGLFAGEIGSMSEGPKLNDVAPDFTLKTVDGKHTIQLTKLNKAKPVVIVFGSFT